MLNARSRPGPPPPAPTRDVLCAIPPVWVERGRSTPLGPSGARARRVAVSPVTAGLVGDEVVIRIPEPVDPLR